MRNMVFFLVLVVIYVNWYWTCTLLCCHSSDSSTCWKQSEVHGAPLWHPDCCSPTSRLRAWAVGQTFRCYFQHVKSKKKKGWIPRRRCYLLVETWAAESDWLGDVEVRAEWSWGITEAMKGHLQLRWTATVVLRRLVFVETSSQSCDL